MTYSPTAVATSYGPAVPLLSGSGTRTYTNRFGTTTTLPVTVRTQPVASLNLQFTVPVEPSAGVVLFSATAVQAPGLGPNSQVSIFTFTTTPTPSPILRCHSGPVGHRLAVESPAS